MDSECFSILSGVKEGPPLPAGHSGDQLIVELSILLTKRYLPQLRIFRTDPTELGGRRCVVSPITAVIVYDETLPDHEKLTVVESALRLLWEKRNLAGLRAFLPPRRHLGAVS